MKNLFIAILLISIPVLCSAQFNTIGRWGVDTTYSEFMYAATLNDTGSVFGQYCYKSTQSCLYLIGLKTSCNVGHRYYVLSNSDIGSNVFEIYCNGPLISGLYQYVFTNFNKIDDLVKNGSRVGFAMPLQDSTFIVVRFSLYGSTSAVERLRKMVDIFLYDKKKKYYLPSEEVIY